MRPCSLFMAGENVTWGRVGPLEPPQHSGEGGGLKRGSKGHKLISSIQMFENFWLPLICRGGGGVERLTTTGGAPHPLGGTQ